MRKPAGAWLATGVVGCGFAQVTLLVRGSGPDLEPRLANSAVPPPRPWAPIAVSSSLRPRICHLTVRPVQNPTEPCRAPGANMSSSTKHGQTITQCRARWPPPAPLWADRRPQEKTSYSSFSSPPRPPFLHQQRGGNGCHFGGHSQGERRKRERSRRPRRVSAGSHTCLGSVSPVAVVWEIEGLGGSSPPSNSSSWR